jgi:predicted nucleic acid-binding protein
MTKNDPVYLLDSSVLIPLFVAEHEFHGTAVQWMSARSRYSTCPITQGALVRHLFRLGAGVNARALLEWIHADSRHEFWADAIDFRSVRLEPVLGHRIVTDAYLVALAHHYGGRLATFDRALVEVFPQAELVSADL